MPHTDASKASVDVVLRGDAQAVTLKDVVEDMTEADISPFEGLIPRPWEPIGALSLIPGWPSTCYQPCC